MKDVYFYLAIACCALGAVAFGLAFTPLKIYALIAAIIFELAALAFIAAQRKKRDFNAVFTVKVISYVLLLAFVAVFIGGLVYSAT